MTRTEEKQLRRSLKELEYALHCAEFKGLRVMQSMPPWELLPNEDPNSPQPDTRRTAEKLVRQLQEHRKMVREWASALS